MIREMKITGDSKAIITNQTEIHEKLDEVVNRHLQYPSKKPFQVHTKQAFAEIDPIVQAFDGDIILDSCCGVGQSTRLLAQRNPNALVIGVDKSAHRINRNVEELTEEDGLENVSNYHLIRADLNDFYRLVVLAKWTVTQHFILYPNPWPKSKHLQRRWHGSAVFPELMHIGQEIILRSNWRLYLEEFQQAADIVGINGDIKVVTDKVSLTPFEAKYTASGQTCWQLSLLRNT